MSEGAKTSPVPIAVNWYKILQNSSLKGKTYLTDRIFMDIIPIITYQTNRKMG